MTLTRYLDLLKNIPARMYATTTPAGGDTERVVAKVLTLSHTRIQQINPLAIRVLNLLACFAPDNLPCSILDRLPETHPLQVGEALALLASYSLITLTPSPADLQPGEPEDLVSVHRLIQAVTLHQLTPDQHNHSRQAAADLVLAALPSDPDTIDAWPAYRALLPHARTVLPPGSPGLYLLVDYLDASGDYRNALQLQQDICIHAVAALGAEHPDTLTTRHDLAVLTGRRGRGRRPRPARHPAPHRRARPGRRTPPHPDHPARNRLLDGEAGDAAAARDQHAALLPIEERVLGTEHPDTLNTRHDLASWTGEAGDAAAARDQYAALLPIEERVLGAEHPDTLTTRANLARWTGAAGDAAAARDQYAILLPIEERVLGTEHPHTLNTRHDLASWTGRRGTRPPPATNSPPCSPSKSASWAPNTPTP
ncbi:tetratricopeptide repeat protein [Nonomuraea thailandensis]